ncbi:MAG: hypothetical protein R3F14_00945 [Polyangiaceae bacterium]
MHEIGDLGARCIGRPAQGHHLKAERVHGGPESRHVGREGGHLLREGGGVSLLFAPQPYDPARPERAEERQHKRSQQRHLPALLPLRALSRLVVTSPFTLP